MAQSKQLELKSVILECGLDKELAKARNQIFRNDDRSRFEELEALYGSELLSVANNLNIATRKRKNRVRSRCETFVLSGKAIFLTLTFSDDVLAKTSEKTRRRYVTRFLASQASRYVANIDYGNDGKKRAYKDAKGKERVSTAREHYHALVYAPRVDFKAWQYGGIDAERVNSTKGDSQAVSKYVAKLTNHAMKMNGGKAPRLIYSRFTYDSAEHIKADNDLVALLDSLKSDF